MEEKFKDKRFRETSERIDRLLNLLPFYVKEYDLYLTDTVQIKTRAEYLQDLYTFMRYLVQNNPTVNNTSDITLDTLQSLNLSDFNEYKAYLHSYSYGDKTYNNSVTTLRRKLTSLKRFYHFLFISDMISTNPAEKIVMPAVKSKKRSEIRILENNEKFEIFDAFENKLNTTLSPVKRAAVLRDKAIFYLFLGTGLRVSELCAIDLENINFKLKYINVIRKEDLDSDGTTDRVYLSDAVCEALIAYINERNILLPPEGSDALFLSSKKQRITTRGVEKMVKKYADENLAVGSGITPHKLRATFGTNYYAFTSDITATSSVMNHSDISTTARYYLKEDKQAKMRVKDMEI